MAVINELEEICQYSVQYEFGTITVEELLEYYKNYLRIKANFSEYEITKFERFAFVLFAKCAELNESQTHEYASALNNIIRDSELSSKEKNEMAETAQFIINSSLCWKQL